MDIFSCITEAELIYLIILILLVLLCKANSHYNSGQFYFYKQQSTIKFDISVGGAFA